MKRISAVLMILVLLLSCGCNSRNNKEDNTDAENISQMMVAYNAEKTILERELKEKINQYEAVLGGSKCYFVLFLDNIEKNLIDAVLPEVADYGYAATAIMSDLHIPTEEGYISRSDYDKLVQAGWDFAIGTGSLDLSGDDKTDVFKNYIDSYRVLLNGAGISMPETIYFHQGDYSEALLEVIVEEGFKVVCCRDGLNDRYSRALGLNGLFMMESGYVNGTSSAELRNILTTANQKNLTYAITTRYLVDSLGAENKALDCTKVKYADMFNFFMTECTDVSVVTPTVLYKYKEEVLMQEYGLHEEELKEIEAQQARLAEINAALDEIDRMIKARLD